MGMRMGIGPLQLVDAAAKVDEHRCHLDELVHHHFARVHCGSSSEARLARGGADVWRVPLREGAWSRRAATTNLIGSVRPTLTGIHCARLTLLIN
eukprot:CAMPEP_0174755832 /NCGR_PEP_ID=MMETSP1094-20130205/106450_1 /TAXON_ID=156173 /ORGANISM="Chrysochromulina brevifilum, Strain UTEX LB 985" /LENGTH=94 /DNA_ID=CAMNT_0015961731 /DNA_START=185 /DNA_END=469 /DNA_ORIENTATION=-